MSTIIVGGILLFVVIMIIRKLVRDKKAGKSSCGCDCGCCGNSAICHKSQEQKNKS